MGLVAPRRVGSSQTRARTRVPCIGRWILNQCTTREASYSVLYHIEKSIVWWAWLAWWKSKSLRIRNPSLLGNLGGTDLHPCHKTQWNDDSSGMINSFWVSTSLILHLPPRAETGSASGDEILSKGEGGNQVYHWIASTMNQGKRPGLEVNRSGCKSCSCLYLLSVCITGF